jgi:hypothetical protein
MARLQPAVADAFPTRPQGGENRQDAGGGCVGRDGVRAWQALPASRRHGSAAANRLGVGLGGDRRVWRYLSSTLTQPQPTANRPLRRKTRACPPDCSLLSKADGKALSPLWAEHRYAIQVLGGGCPGHIEREQRQLGRAAPTPHPYLTAIPQLTDDRNAWKIRSVVASASSRRSRSPASPGVSQEPENRTHARSVDRMWPGSGWRDVPATERRGV